MSPLWEGASLQGCFVDSSRASVHISQIEYFHALLRALVLCNFSGKRLKSVLNTLYATQECYRNDVRPHAHFVIATTAHGGIGSPIQQHLLIRALALVRRPVEVQQAI